jgi:hypothetical protein
MRKPVFDIKWRELREGDLISMKDWWPSDSRAPRALGDFPTNRMGLVLGVHPDRELNARVTVLCEGEFYQKMPAQLTVVSCPIHPPAAFDAS